MLTHHRAHSLSIAKVTRMSQLIDLVRANATDTRMTGVPLTVLRRSHEEGHTRAGESNLRSRSKRPETVRVTRRLTKPNDVDDLRELIGQSMNGVSVIPHHAEVRRRGLHRAQTLC